MALVETEIKDKILEVKMNFNKDNTVTWEAMAAMNETLKGYEDDKGVHCVILSSQAEGYFSNGLDPDIFVGKSKEEIKDAWRFIMDSFLNIWQFPRPVIAQITGHVMALGSVWATGADYRYMQAKSGRFGFPESMISLNFPVIAAVILKELVGTQNARDLIYSGRGVKPEEGKEMGLVDEVFEKDEMIAKTRKQAEKIAKLTLESAMGIKKAFRQSYLPLAKDMDDWGLEQMAMTSHSANAQEGFLSLKEKRRPVFND